MSIKLRMPAREFGPPAKKPRFDGPLAGSGVGLQFGITAVGASIAPALVLTETLVQEGTDLHQRGRVFSLRDFAMRLLLLGSLALATLLTPLLGTTPTLIVAAVCIAGAGVLSMAWGRRARELMTVPPRAPR